jgi:hypothetical protein
MPPTVNVTQEIISKGQHSPHDYWGIRASTCPIFLAIHEVVPEAYRVSYSGVYNKKFEYLFFLPTEAREWMQEADSELSKILHGGMSSNLKPIQFQLLEVGEANANYS